MADNEIKKCFHCKVEIQQPDINLTGIAFHYLEGEPVICERCMARTFGIEGTWKVDVESKMEEK